LELVNLVNLLLCLVIVAMGLIGYVKSKHRLPLSLAVVFGLFAASHALVLAGLLSELEMVVFALRILAYALVILLLYRYIQVLDIF
jgi:Ca2+/Na+ antiporter